MSNLERLLPTRIRMGVYRTAQLARDLRASWRADRTLRRETHVSQHFTPDRIRAVAPILSREKRTGGIVTFTSLDASVDVRPGETVLEAGLRADLDLIYSCTLGGCAACMLKITSGEVTYDDPESLCLTDEDYADRMILACVAKPVGNITLEEP